MADTSDFFLENTPLPDTDTVIAFDIFADEGKRGEISQKKLLEGKITLNPDRCLLFFIPPDLPGAESEQFVVAPEREKWDIYLLMLPFTLHDTPSYAYYHEVTFWVELLSPEATVLDFFPRNIPTEAAAEQRYILNPGIQVQPRQAGEQENIHSIRFAALHPIVTAFGEGQSQFYWKYEGYKGQKAVMPETKQALAVLQVPRGTTEVVGTIRYELLMAMKHLSVWKWFDGETEPYTMRWKLNEAPTLFASTTQQAEKPAHSKSKQHSPVDVCIVCGMAEEARAFLQVASRLYGVSFSEEFHSLTKHPYYRTILSNHRGEPLTVIVSWQHTYGPVEAGLHIRPLFEEYKPRFAAMTGICAGNRGKVNLSDLIVAERAFFYDTGKFTLTADHQLEHLHDVDSYRSRFEVLHWASMFDHAQEALAQLSRPLSLHQQRDWLLQQLLNLPTHSFDEIEHQAVATHAPDWRKIVANLQQGPSPYLTAERRLNLHQQIEQLLYGREAFPFQDPPVPAIHIAVMASGNAVRADNPFREVSIPVRSTLAIDMEGATFYRVAAEFPTIYALLVKGVCDFADSEKDDSYHAYAAEASAVYVLSFLQTYVNDELMPR